MGFTLQAGRTFALREAGTFAASFPGTRVVLEDGVLRLAWAVEADWRVVTVTLRQDGTTIHGDVAHSPPRDLTLKAKRDVERILCLDGEEDGFLEVGRRDPVVGRLQHDRPGLRPVLFFTPYEAAAWSIIGQRIQMRQAAVIKQRLSDELGEGGAFPSPRKLADLPSAQAGLTDRKVEQLRSLGEAAHRGKLDRDRLRRMSHSEALADLQHHPGIGPFSAELILIRGVGTRDMLPTAERRLTAITRTLYQLSDDADITAVTDQWRPYRSWVAFLARASH